MLSEQVVENHKVLVELSVIPLGSNGHTCEHISDVLSVLDKTGLFLQRTHNGSCIEGEWKDISPLIFACYERLQAQSPQGFITISIR